MDDDDVKLVLAIGPKEVTVNLVCLHCGQIILKEYIELYRENKPTIAKGHCGACIRISAGAGGELIAICKQGCGRVHPVMRPIE